MKKIILIILYVVIACQFGHSQLLPEKCSAFCPSELNKSFIRQSSIEKLLLNNYGQSDTPTFCYWDAYSDRCDNEVYNGPSTSSGKSGKKLSFNQKVRIAEIKNRFAWVYIENKPGAVNYPQLSSDCEAVGWIPMDNLLLWQRCPTDERCIYHKAFLMVNIDEYTKTKSNGTEKELGLVFDNPMARSNPQKITTGKELYFIMKEDKESGMVLLSKSEVLTHNTSQVLYGWVNKASYIPWNNRVCLEPNWDPDIVEKLKGSKVNIYRGNVITSEFTYGITNDIGQEKTKYRMPPNEMRFPLLENESENNNKYRIIAFTTTGESKKSEILLKTHFDSPFLNDYVLAFQGFTDIKDSITGLDYWKPVMLLSSEELVELIKKLEPLKNAVRVSTYGNEERAKYVKAVKGVIQCLTELSSEYIEQLSSAEITDIIEGLNITTSLLKGQIGDKRYTMSDIRNPKICSDKDFKMIVKKVEDKIEDLEQIPKSSHYKFSFIQNGVKHYWIPVEMLP